MSTASVNATSDADRMLSLNSTGASVDMTLTSTGAFLNHSARSPMVPPTPGSANATQVQLRLRLYHDEHLKTAC